MKTKDLETYKKDGTNASKSQIKEFIKLYAKIAKKLKTENSIELNSVKENIRKTYSEEVYLTLIDEDIKVQISKQDITNKKEIEGAKLKVVDKDGNNIDEWTSGKEPHMIKNLNVGESYTLIEETAPQGYKIAESIDFKIEDTGAIQHVVMYDEHLPVKVKTGDDNLYQYWIVSGLLSLAALLIIRFKVKREQQ